MSNLSPPLAAFASPRGRRRSPARKIAARTLPGAAILALVALVGAQMTRTGGGEAGVYGALSPWREAAQGPQTAADAMSRTAQADDGSAVYGGLFDPRPAVAAMGPLSSLFTMQAELEPQDGADAAANATVAIREPDAADARTPFAAPGALALNEDAPLPAPRPRDLDVPAAPTPRIVPQIPDRRLAREQRAAPASTAQANGGSNGGSIFDKLFSGLKSLGQQPGKPTGPVLAYAPADGGVVSDAPRLSPRVGPTVAPRAEGGTAIYDISARTVYMPDGTRLEAHSGLGEHMDNPNSVHIPMRGATPPNVYELTMREALFHGVQALRMTPIGASPQYGRNGFLTHTYMLGPNGASNGCVSFRNYAAFLRAFQTGQVRRLVVVARM